LDRTADAGVRHGRSVSADGGTHVHATGRGAGHAHYWLPLVQSWANQRGHLIDWIDNCWLRVRIGAAELVDFLETVLGPNDYRTVDVKPAIDLAQRYVIVAEEF